MTAPSSDVGRHIIPPEENRCVWMTAGVLSYRLCEREFDCENCPLDTAMREHFTRGGAPAATSGHPESHDAPAPARGALERDRLYSRGHCWVRWLSAAPMECPCPGGPASRPPGARALARVGVEPGLAAAVLAPREVVRPEPGEPLRRGQAHAWIVTEGGTLPVVAPLTGRVTDVNATLQDRPHTLAADPLGEGWLYELEVADPAAELATLLTAEAVEPLYEADASRFRVELARALRPAGAEAPALPDGGQVLRDVSEMLGPSKYFALLGKVFG